MSKKTTILQTSNLHLGYYNKKKPVKLLTETQNLKLKRGTFTCLLGPNGSGKSTLIRTLAGLQKCLEGSVELEGRTINKISLKEKSFLLSMVLTEQPATANISLEELVGMGRYPYTGMMGRFTEQDHEKIEEAIEVTQLQYLRKRKLWQLSDGERQKAMIARALAQDTPLVMLDEPTAHLDLNNRIELMYLLRKLSHELNKAILLSTHDLDIALQCADEFWLMQPCEKIVTGVPEDLVLKGEFEKTFFGEKFSFEQETGAFKINEGVNKKIKLLGEGIPYFWTKHAMRRNNYDIENEKCEIEVIIKIVNGNNVEWQVNKNGKKIYQCDSIELLIDNLLNLN